MLFRSSLDNCLEDYLEVYKWLLKLRCQLQVETDKCRQSIYDELLLPIPIRSEIAVNMPDNNNGQSVVPKSAAKKETDSWAADQKIHSTEALESRVAREKERLDWEEEERQKKIKEREDAEKLRQDAERRALYSELESLDFNLLSLLDFPTDHEIGRASCRERV